MNKNPNYGLFAVAVAIAMIGAAWLGVSLATLALLAVVLACPLMMMLMMRDMHGGSSEHRHPEDRENPHDSTSRR